MYGTASPPHGLVTELPMKAGGTDTWSECRSPQVVRVVRMRQERLFTWRDILGSSAPALEIVTSLRCHESEGLPS